MVHLYPRVLDLERQHVQHMLTLDRLGYQSLDMLQPRRHVAAARHGRPGVQPCVAVDVARSVDQRRLAGGVGQPLQGAPAAALAVLVIGHGRLDRAARSDRLAGDVPEQRIKVGAGQIAARLQIKVPIVGHDVGEAFVPCRPLDPAHLGPIDLGHPRGGGVGKLVGGGQALPHFRHALGQQFIPQPVLDPWPALFKHPIKERRAIQVFTVPMVAAKRTVEGAIPGFNLPVRVRRIVRADHAAPALGVGA